MLLDINSYHFVLLELVQLGRELGQDHDAVADIRRGDDVEDVPCQLDQLLDVLAVVGRLLQTQDVDVVLLDEVGHPRHVVPVLGVLPLVHVQAGHTQKGLRLLGHVVHAFVSILIMAI